MIVSRRQLTATLLGSSHGNITKLFKWFYFLTSFQKPFFFQIKTLVCIDKVWIKSNEINLKSFNGCSAADTAWSIKQCHIILGVCEKYQLEGDHCNVFDKLNGHCSCGAGLHCAFVPDPTTTSAKRSMIAPSVPGSYRCTPIFWITFPDF